MRSKTGSLMTRLMMAMTSISKSTFAKRKPRHLPILTRARHRSPLEDRTAALLKDKGVPYEYEGTKFKFTVPARESTYTPDWHLNGKFYVETKGWPFEAEDRQRLLLVKEQHPDLDLRIVFQNPKRPIYKGSKTTLAMWAESHGIPWSGEPIPDDWIKEALDV